MKIWGMVAISCLVYFGLSSKESAVKFNSSKEPSSAIQDQDLHSELSETASISQDQAACCQPSNTSNDPLYESHHFARHISFDVLDLPSNAQQVVGSQIRAFGAKTVVMYGVPWCEYCIKARAFLISNNIPFVEIDPTQTRLNGLAYESLNSPGYPLIYWGEMRFEGLTRQLKRVLLQG